MELYETYHYSLLVEKRKNKKNKVKEDTKERKNIILNKKIFMKSLWHYLAYM
jgi:hypothetical protein